MDRQGIIYNKKIEIRQNKLRQIFKLFANLCQYSVRCGIKYFKMSVLCAINFLKI